MDYEWKIRNSFKGHDGSLTRWLMDVYSAWTFFFLSHNFNSGGAKQIVLFIQDVCPCVVSRVIVCVAHRYSMSALSWGDPVLTNFFSHHGVVVVFLQLVWRICRQGFCYNLFWHQFDCQKLTDSSNMHGARNVLLSWKTALMAFGQQGGSSTLGFVWAARQLGKDIGILCRYG